MKVKNMGKSGEQRRGAHFNRGRSQIGRAVINKKSVGGKWEL